MIVFSDAYQVYSVLFQGEDRGCFYDRADAEARLRALQSIHRAALRRRNGRRV